MNITLKPEEEQFIQEKLKSGKYETAYEVIVEALRLLEERDKHSEKWLEETRKEVVLGIEQLDRSENFLQLLTEIRFCFEALYGEKLVQLVLYGSQARGDAESDSDIDILVILREPVDAWKEIDITGEFISALSLKYDVVISRNFVSLARLQQENSPFFINVRREGVLI